MAECMVNLAELPVSHMGRVIGLKVEGLTRRRLLDLGLVPGTKVEAVRRSPTGDPIAYNVRGALIALRQEDSRKIIVGV